MAALSTPELRYELESLGNTIDSQWGQTLLQWPGLTVDDDQFFFSWAKRVCEAEEPAAALRTIRVPELYLAFACAAGCAKAIEAFQLHYVPALRTALRRMRIGDALVDDVLQTVQFRLLVGSEHSGAKIESFGGRGKLASWLRVVAMREAQQLLDRQARELPVSDAELAASSRQSPSLIPVARDPELALLHQQFRHELADIFPLAITRLESRQRALLRLDMLDGLNHGQIASIYQVHRTTILRWLHEAERDLCVAVHDLLRERLELAEGEFSSLLRAVRSQLSVSVGRALLEHQSASSI